MMAVTIANSVNVFLLFEQLCMVEQEKIHFTKMHLTIESYFGKLRNKKSCSRKNNELMTELKITYTNELHILSIKKDI